MNICNGRTVRMKIPFKILKNPLDTDWSKLFNKKEYIYTIIYSNNNNIINLNNSFNINNDNYFEIQNK
jgi:hypothetical protein